MNTIGKILVILNFLFAVVVGVFLVSDFALRTKWQEAYKVLQRDAEVLRVERDTTSRASLSVTNDYVQAKKNNEALKTEMKEKQDEAQQREAALKIDIESLQFRLKDGDLSLQEAQKAKQRLIDEIAILNKSIKDREAKIVLLDADLKTYRIVAMNNESLAKTRQTQNELLLDQVQMLTAKIARLEVGATVDGGVVRSTGLNPPAVKVRGVINVVDKVDNGLVEISLGTDHGVAKNHTLDVYRLSPKAEYVGAIRITDAYPHKSVARLIPTGSPALRPQLRQGDEVASYINK